MASIITHNPAVYECFKQKLLNYHALAANIKPEVERQANRPTTINTIVAALVRFSDNVAEVSEPKPQSILRDARITLSSDVMDITITPSKTEMPNLVKRISDLSLALNEPIHLFQLSHSIKLIADEGEYNSTIRPSLEKGQIARETGRLSRLDIHLSPKVETTPEFGLFLTELLFRHGIRIRHTYIGEETILILEREGGPKAYEILREEVDRSRSLLVDALGSSPIARRGKRTG